MRTKNHLAPTNHFFVGQFQHILILTGLLAGAFFIGQPSLDNSQWLGISDYTWFYASIIVVIIHQVIGWLVFRSQLCFSFLTRIFGKYDLIVWGVIFMPLLILRLLLTLGLGMADYGSMPQYRGVQIFLGLILMIPVVYSIWSVMKYFGIPRALGADHFRKEYQELPMVKKGAFKYSSNAMYTFVLLIFWAIALLTGSIAALAVALFQHAYIWVHFYCVEEPDMRLIYPENG